MNPEKIILKDFSGRKTRDEISSRWLYSVVDFIQFVTHEYNHNKAGKYWYIQKKRLGISGEPALKKILRRKLPVCNGKYYPTDVADMETLMDLLRVITSPQRAQLLKELGIAITKQRNEFAFGADIIENLFSDYDIIAQMPVLKGKYRIDWYIPEIKLAIEYDETDHEFREKEDIDRQHAIEAELGCHFVRYKENFKRNRSSPIFLAPG